MTPQSGVLTVGSRYRQGGGRDFPVLFGKGDFCPSSQAAGGRIPPDAPGGRDPARVPDGKGERRCGLGLLRASPSSERGLGSRESTVG